MEPFLGEIRPFPFTFAPLGWAFCEGQILPIIQNEALFSLIGTTYGGNGQTTFALPDLRSRVPMHQGSSSPLGQAAGVERVTLDATQIPAHTHGLAVGGAATQSSPAGAVPAKGVNRAYASTATGTLAPDSLTAAGSSQSHANVQPYLAIAFCIALEGVYPSPN